VISAGRVFLLKKGREKKGPVVYWMSRDQRLMDNWALLFAIEQANELNVPCHIIFTLSSSFLGAGLRQFDFMLTGLKELEVQSENLGLAFHVLMGKPENTLPNLLNDINASSLVSDFDPLAIKRRWKKEVTEKIEIPHFEIDTHNIVPCRVASGKQEFGAYTIRPKIKRLLTEYLTEIPSIPEVKVKTRFVPIDWERVMEWLNPDISVNVVSWLKPGYKAGNDILQNFLGVGINGYLLNRNNPLLNGQSNLSPYLHFGQISAQRVAIEVSKVNAPEEDKSAFLEELIVRRELSDNFCFYNNDYDNTKGFHSWAKETHNQHRNDERDNIYSLREFESGQTHDPLWNAAQMEMVKTGKMHGYMRMYWAKKILEWTNSPEEAMKIAIYLNDKYSLDGRDPNGYAGIAWSIGGVHDRAWNERPIFGKIRYMNYNGCRRKFNVDAYIENVQSL